MTTIVALLAALMGFAFGVIGAVVVIAWADR